MSGIAPVWAMQAPEGKPLPRIIYYLIYSGGSDAATHGGKSESPEPSEVLIQFNAKAANFLQAITLGEQIQELWEGYSGGNDSAWIESCFSENARGVTADEVLNDGRNVSYSYSCDYRFSYRSRTQIELDAERSLVQAYPLQFPTYEPTLH